MFPALLLAAAFATTPELRPAAEPAFTDPLLIKMEDVARKNLDRCNAVVADQVKIRTKILAECGGRPPNEVQKASLDIADEQIKEFTKGARYYQQTLDALEKHKRGTPWAECGFPKPNEK